MGEGEGDGVQRPSLHVANKVVQILDPTTSTCVALPALWPSSAEDGFLHKLAEIYAVKMESPGESAGAACLAREGRAPPGLVHAAVAG